MASLAAVRLARHLTIATTALLDESVDDHLDAVAHRLERYGDDHHRTVGNHSGLLALPRDNDQQGLQQLLGDREDGRQHYRKRDIDEGAVDDEVYVPQAVAQDLGSAR